MTRCYTLVPASNRGHYALDDPQHGQDIESGDSLAILFAGRWIEGSIEHKANVYAIEHGPRLVSSGYCFNARDGGMCGLCVGMKVRLGWDQHLQRGKLQDQGHVPMRIMSIGATMGGTGRIVLLNRSLGRAGRCYQSAGMAEPYHGIILGVNQQNRWRYGTSHAQCLLDAMVSNHPVRARHQPMMMACLKQESFPRNVRRVSEGIRVRVTRAGPCHPAVS